MAAEVWAVSSSFACRRFTHALASPAADVLGLVDGERSREGEISDAPGDSHLRVTRSRESSLFADLAQMVERVPSKHKVAGSMPAVRSNHLQDLSWQRAR